MFEEAGFDVAAVRRLRKPYLGWLIPRLADGRYFGWFFTGSRGEVLAGLGMIELDWPPHPRHGYILNVFVEPGHRRRGLARALVQGANEEASRRGIEYLVLHASPLGRPLYESLGWRPTNEMSLQIHNDS